MLQLIPTGYCKSVGKKYPLLSSMTFKFKTTETTELCLGKLQEELQEIEER
jgi:hypothetical protein